MLMTDNEIRLKVYMLIASRYKQLISEKEQKNISEIRQRCSPYADFVKKLRERLAGNANYAYPGGFLHAVERILEYVRTVKNLELLITFWMDFEEIDEIRAASTMDKALLITALLRAFDSQNARVAVTKGSRSYVCFEHEGKKYAITPETGSLFVDGDVDKLFNSDSIAYSFNDLVYENYEE